ncbi:MAG: hypothetical protein RSB41_00320 [Bacilli bacterium]
MKKLFKENKILFILGAVIFISIIVIIVCMFIYFFGKDANKYGNRLNGIESVEISKDNETKLNNLYKDNKSVNKVNYNLKGKIIYITIELKEVLKLEDAKSLAVKSLEVFSDEVKAYYDISYTINVLDNKDNKLYPTQGYKNNSSAQIVWVKPNTQE